MTIYEKEPKFSLLGRDFGNKDNNEVTGPEPLQVREKMDNKGRHHVYLRGNGQWHGRFIKVIDQDTVVFGSQAVSTFNNRIHYREGIEVTLTADEINNHPLVGQLLHWKP